MGRSINGVPETADMPGYNFPRPFLSHPLAFWPKPSSSQVYTETTFEKEKINTGSRLGLPGSPGPWVDPPGRLGFAGLLH
jgi:hypothetical protein